MLHQPGKPMSVFLHKNKQLLCILNFVRNSGTVTSVMSMVDPYRLSSSVNQTTYFIFI